MPTDGGEIIINWRVSDDVVIAIEDVGVLSVNGRQAAFDQQLKSGDLIHIMPPHRRCLIE